MPALDLDRGARQEGAMIRLILIVLVFGIGYSAFWVQSSRSARAETLAQAEALRALGWEVDLGDIRVLGFPSRTDIWIETPRLAAPSGLSWEAPFLQSLGLAYRGGRILALPETQSVTLGGIEIAVASQGLRASLGDEQIVAEAESLMLQGGGVTLTAGPVLFALRPAGEETWELYLRATDLGADGTPAGELVLTGLATVDAGRAELRGFDLQSLTAEDPEALAAALAPGFPALAEGIRQRQ